MDFINLKCRPEMVAMLHADPDVLPAYHMNKMHWLTIVLDRDFTLDDIYPFIDQSYQMTATKVKRRQ